MVAKAGVTVQVADQCMYGLRTWGKDRNKKDTPARKRTKFMTNCPEIAEELRKRCSGRHIHQQLINGRAKEAGKYPEELCRAICRGLMRAMEMQVMNIRHLMTVSKEDAIGMDTEKERGVGHEEDGERRQAAHDDVAGEVPDPNEMMRASLGE